MQFLQNFFSEILFIFFGRRTEIAEFGKRREKVLRKAFKLAGERLKWRGGVLRGCGVYL